MSAVPQEPWPADEEATIFAVGDADWEPGLLSALRHPSIRLSIVKRCLDAVEMIAATQTTMARQVLISPSLARLDLDVVARLKSSGIRVVGIINTGQEQDEILLRQLGVSTIVSADLHRLGAAAAVVASIMKVSPTPAVAPSLAINSGLTHPAKLAKVIAVWGPPGSTGKSTTAMTVADEMAADGANVLLIDADIDAPSLAPMLAVVDAPGTLHVAMRKAAAGRLDSEGASELCAKINERLWLLVGSGRSGHRAELRSPAFAAVRRTILASWDVVVIDLGSVPLPGEGLGEQASLAAFDVLDEADEVVVVGGHTLIDIQRLIHALDALNEALPQVRPRVVINRCAPQSDILSALTHHTRVSAEAVAFIPEDVSAYSAAMRDGLTVRECAPRSKARLHAREFIQRLRSSGA